MNKIKTIIIDDEVLARDIIKVFLSKHSEFELIGEASNGFDGIKQINELNPDLIFLDIQMPKLNGFEMLELIEQPPAIIFTTAFDQYALKAFDVNAMDYLLKPFSEERFSEALDKAKKIIGNLEETKKNFDKIINSNFKQKEFLERIVIKSGSKITFVPIDEIKYIEAQDDYTMLYTSKGKFLKQKTMKFFEESLNPENFVRIHRSYIVKVDEVKQLELLEKETYYVILNNGTKLSVSKTGYKKLKELIK